MDDIIFQEGPEYEEENEEAVWDAILARIEQEDTPYWEDWSVPEELDDA